MTAISPATRNHERLTRTSLPAIDPTFNVPGGHDGAGPRDPRSSLIRPRLTDRRTTRGFPALSVRLA